MANIYAKTASRLNEAVFVLEFDISIAALLPLIIKTGILPGQYHFGLPFELHDNIPFVLLICRGHTEKFRSCFLFAAKFVSAVDWKTVQ
jgi:hypothetical protein